MAIFTVNAPTSGTFYVRPFPEDLPFVKVGQQVRAGDPVCIVESMKVFMEVITERAGIVRRILVENEDAVRTYQPLIELETA
ncbi:MAG: biotin/lipoyl-containing protein [Candidatus Bathyarchaeota archaeon]